MKTEKMRKKENPPFFANLLLKLVLDRSEYLEFVGDIDEIYKQMTAAGPHWKARFWYWLRVLESAPAIIRAHLWGGMAVIGNYLKITVRNLKKHKVYSFINIMGLALGLACCLMIGLYVQDELRYDYFHQDPDRIFKVVSDLKPPGDADVAKLASNGWPVGQSLKAAYPEIEEVVYLRKWPRYAIKHQDQYFFENMLYADEAFFRVFSFPLLQGSSDTALTAPYSLILTEEMAHKYFGEAEALGQSLILNDDLECQITGVVRVPEHSHLQFDLLLSFATLCAESPENCQAQFADGWYNMNVYNYVRLREGVESDVFEEKISGHVTRSKGEFQGYNTTLRLQPLRDIYLRSQRGNGLGPASDIGYVYMLSAIAFFILLIACINFMNLTTARSTKRAKEVGVRKVVGSTWGALMRQFLHESVLMCGLALIAALGLLLLILPFFNQLVGKSIMLADLFNVQAVLLLLAFVLFVGGLAGFYPALVLSSYGPMDVIKNRFQAGLKGTRLRQGLVVFQFAASCVLITATIVVFNQLKFMQSQSLGFEKEQVVVLDARQADAGVRIEKYQAIKQELKAHPSVQSVSASGAVPGRSGWRNQFAQPEGRAEDDGVELEYLAADHDFVETLGLEMAAGRDFSPAYATDKDTAVLINEAAVEHIGWGSPQNAVGKRLDSFGSGKPVGIVVGVVKDYHHHGLQENIGPMMFGITPSAFSLFAVRIDTTDVSASLAHLEDVWDRFFAGYDFRYFFLDDDYERQYLSEKRLMKIFAGFASLAVLIACLGLFGLAAYTAERRTKEIGIRKVLGASGTGIVLLLSKEFSRLILISFGIALPIAYFGLNRWLAGFAYHTKIHAGVFLLTGLVVAAGAWLTVSYQSIKAAGADPVKSLRYE